MSFDRMEQKANASLECVSSLTQSFLTNVKAEREALSSKKAKKKTVKRQNKNNMRMLEGTTHNGQ
tara:strand:- start:4665 stop:4859 length:195 start_codon:yes stop_codon:yes gene_type:complete